MASSGVGRIFLHLMAAAIIVSASTITVYLLQTHGDKTAILPAVASTEPSTEVPTRTLTPEDPKMVPGVTRVQSGPRAGELQCSRGYTPSLLVFNTNQPIGMAQVGTTIDLDGVTIRAINTVVQEVSLGASLIVNKHLTAAVPTSPNVQFQVLFLPSSRFYPQGWERRFTTEDQIVLCGRRLAA